MEALLTPGVESRINPYVGPRPFTEEDEARFFGRDREAAEMVSLVVAHRTVLLYAQSGAGKSSLVRARLIPALRRRGFDVLPVARVSGAAAATAGANVFAANTIGSWVSADATTMREALEKLPVVLDGRGTPMPRVAVFDQFEELFTAHPERFDDRNAFLRELADLVEGDAIARVVLVIREDYLASLASLEDLFPEELRTRYRLQRLRRDAALPAIQDPLRGAGVSFQPGVAEELVNDLLRTPQGAVEFVEPVQLQVACFTLFERLPAGATIITRDHLESFGNVDEALRNYYDESLERAVRTSGVPESRLREWFDTKLIIEGRARGMSFRGTASTDGVPNAAVDALAAQHLVVGDKRGDGSVWYELSHDRFIEPIRKANERWRERTAVLRALRRWALVGGTVAVGLLVALTVLQQQRKLIGMQQQTLMESERATAAARRAAGETEKAARAVFERDLKSAEAEAAEARRYASELEVRESQYQREMLAALAGSHGATRPDLAALISLQALRENTNDIEARATLLGALENNPQLFMYLRDHDHPVIRALFTPNGKAIVSASEDGTVLVWSIDSARPMLPIRTGQVSLLDVAISPDGRLLASAEGAESVRLWDVATGAPHGPRLPGQSWARTVAFSPDSEHVAAAGGDNSIRVWTINQASAPPLILQARTDEVMSVAFSRDGQTFASAGRDGTVQLWNWRQRRELGASIKAHAGSVWAVSFSPDGSTLASAGSDRTIRLWSATDLRLMSRPIVAHGDSVTSIAFNPDGSMLASASADRSVRLWNTADGTPIGPPLIGHADPVLSVAFSPDGRRLVSGANGNDVIVWELDSHQRLGTPRFGHLRSVWAIASSPDGKIIATGGADNRIVLWDSVTRARLGLSLDDHTGGVAALDFNRDGSVLASGSADGTVRLWNVATGRPLGDPLKGSGGTVLAVAFDPTGSRLASAGTDGTVRLWNVADRTLARELAGPGTEMYAVAFSPDGRLLAAGSKSGIIQTWTVASGQPQPPLAGHTDQVRALAFASNQLLVSAGADKQVLAWDLGAAPARSRQLIEADDSLYSLVLSADGRTAFAGARNGKIFQVDVAGLQSPRRPLDGRAGAVNALAMTRSGFLLAANGYGSAIVWNTATGQPVGGPMLGHANAVYSVAFDPRGGRFVSGGWNEATSWTLDAAGDAVNMKSVDGTLEQVVFSPDGRMVAAAGCGKWDSGRCVGGALQFWNPDTGDRTRDTIATGVANITSVVFADGETIVTGDASGSITLWNVRSGRVVATVPDAHRADVRTLALSPDHRYLASGADDAGVKIWRVGKRSIDWVSDIAKPLDPITTPNQQIRRVIFSPDGRVLASGSQNRAIVLWDVTTPERPRELRRLLGHTGAVEAIAFTPDGRTLLSGSGDSTARLWDVATGRPIGTMRGHTEEINSIAVSPDGRVAVSGAQDGLLFTWDLDVASWRSRVCQMVGRNLDPGESAQYLPGHTPTPMCPEVTTRQADAAALKGDRRKAAQLFDQAVKAALQEHDASLLNNVCWYGALDRFETVVWPACEAAVRRADAEDLGLYADTRGVARALRGDRAGAIKDFGTLLDWSRKYGYQDDTAMQLRREWIDALTSGRDPFTAETLNQLRSEVVNAD